MLGEAIANGNRGPALQLAQMLDDYQPATTYWNDAADCRIRFQEQSLRDDLAYRGPDAGGLITRVFVGADSGGGGGELELGVYDAEQDLWKHATNPHDGNDG